MRGVRGRGCVRCEVRAVAPHYSGEALLMEHKGVEVCS